ncbi:MAG: ABC transporter ATP-binding protein [Anaerolineae bacterium]
MMIHLKDITFAYSPLRPNAPPERIFTHLDLELDRADTRAITGASGTGKSTLSYILAGVAPRYTDGSISGTVQVAGHDLTAERPEVGSVGLLFQDATTQLFTTSAEEEVAWGLEAAGIDPEEIGSRVKLALARFGLASKTQRPPWELSGGEQKRLALAALWATHPELLILDEPLGGLDPQGKADLLNAIQGLRQDGTTLVIMTLRPQVMRQAATVSLLVDGDLAPPKTPAELLEEEKALIDTGILYPPKLWPDLGTARPPADEETALVVENLHHRYQGDEKALRGVSFGIARGEFVALVGPNGAGKSTLIRHFNGLLRPTEGSVFVMGKPIRGRPTGEIAQDIGYVFQRPEQQLFASTVRAEIAYGPQRLRLPDVHQRTERALVRFGLEKDADTPPALLGYGAQRAVTLASVSALDTPIVVLDEPAVGLDGRGLAQLLGWLADLRSKGVTIVLVTHEMALAARADRVIALDEGRVVADGEPEEVLETLSWHEDEL